MVRMLVQMDSMPSPLSLEDRLILACARTAPDARRIEDLAKRGPDWQQILRKVERWGLASLVYTNLRQAAASAPVPPPIAERLRHLSHRDTIHGVARRELLRATLLRFSQAEVPVIVLKGAALAALVYPSASLRPMRDLDLLVRSSDRTRVDVVLHHLRTAPWLPPPAGARPDAIPYLGSERFSVLDVRDHISRSAAARIPIEELWERARPVEIESVPTLVLGDEDLLLNLALQLAEAGRFVGQVRVLCDIGEVCRRYADAIDWSALVDRANRYAVGKELYYCLRLSHELIGASVPPRPLTELRAGFRPLPLEDGLTAAIARRALLAEENGTGLRSRFYGLGMQVLTTQRARDGISTAYRHLARSFRVRLQQIESWRVNPNGGRQNLPLPTVAIVLPIYRPRLEGDALSAVDRAVGVLRHGDWYFIAPQSLDASFYERRYAKPLVRFPDACLASVRAYNRLLLSDEFYGAFARYDYMLVSQDDVYVVRDDLTRWLARGFDYVGAPWPDGLQVILDMSPRPGIQGCELIIYVGNGGFSLRRIAACRRLLAEFSEEAACFAEKAWGEDQFFSSFGQLSTRFVLPNLRMAASFAWETSLRRMHDLCRGQLPMAIHAYGRHDRDFFTDTILPAATTASR
jgi:hypothetical protein